MKHDSMINLQPFPCSVSANPIMIELLGLWYPPLFP
jgi:hypothetical protein